MNELNVPVRGRFVAVVAGCLSFLLVACGLPAVFGQDVGGAPRSAPGIPLRVPSGVEGKSVSTSKQFVIYGRTLPLRSAFSVFAERVKADYLNLIYSTGRGVHPDKIDKWSYPIVLQVRDESPNLDGKAVKTRIRQLEQGGFRLEVTVQVGDGFETEELRYELLRVLLAESILRGHERIRVGGRTELLPKWLMAGVAETLGHKSSRRPSELYDKVFQTGRILTVKEILSTDPVRLDSVSRTIFELSSAGLLQTLLDQPSGANRLRVFISGLATHTGSQRDLLIRHFPGMRTSRNSLEKWWALQMASMSQPGVFDLMSPEETDVALADALIVQFKEPDPEAHTASSGTKAAKTAGMGSSKRPPGIVRVRNGFLGLLRPKGRRVVDSSETAETEASPQPTAVKDGRITVSCGVEEIGRYFDHPDREWVLKPVQMKLAELSYRSHPLYRSVIHDYQGLIGQIADGNREGADANFASLAGRRTLIQRQATAIADHLNWFEATKSETRSGEFKQFHQAIDAIENGRRPGRKDPISRYLDALEQEFK